MAAYEYQALDGKGRRKQVLEADSARQVRQQLREMGLTPLEVSETVEKARRGRPFGFSLLRPSREHRRSGADHPTQLSTLVAAALPIEESLQAVAEQRPKQRTLISAVRGKVLEGHALAGDGHLSLNI